VVLRWGGRTYPDGGTVYLTNGPVADPFVAFDTYDWSSVIENGIFKEGKQPWHLEHFPQRTEAAVLVQCYFNRDRDDPLHGLPPLPGGGGHHAHDGG